MYCQNKAKIDFSQVNYKKGLGRDGRRKGRMEEGEKGGRGERRRGKGVKGKGGRGKTEAG